MNRPRILIADDHPRILDSVKLLLADDFAVVGAVPDGTTLIAAARDLKPDVVVTDFVMEPTNGLEASGVIFAQCEPPPVIILLTGVADPQVVDEAFRIGVQAYVSKSRLSEDLMPAIHGVLAGSRFSSIMPNGEGDLTVRSQSQEKPLNPGEFRGTSHPLSAYLRRNGERTHSARRERFDPCMGRR